MCGMIYGWPGAFIPMTDELRSVCDDVGATDVLIVATHKHDSFGGAVEFVVPTKNIDQLDYIKGKFKNIVIMKRVSPDHQVCSDCFSTSHAAHSCTTGRLCKHCGVADHIGDACPIRLDAVKPPCILCKVVGHCVTSCPKYRAPMVRMDIAARKMKFELVPSSYPLLPSPLPIVPSSSSTMEAHRHHPSRPIPPSFLACPPRPSQQQVNTALQAAAITSAQSAATPSVQPMTWSSRAGTSSSSSSASSNHLDPGFQYQSSHNRFNKPKHRGKAVAVAASTATTVVAIGTASVALTASSPSTDLVRTVNEYITTSTVAANQHRVDMNTRIDAIEQSIDAKFEVFMQRMSINMQSALQQSLKEFASMLHRPPSPSSSSPSSSSLMVPTVPSSSVNAHDGVRTE